MKNGSARALNHWLPLVTMSSTIAGSAIRLQEVVDHDVLVVLAQDPLGLDPAPALVDQRVVRLEERQVQLGDDEVLVVAGIADQRRAVVGVVSRPRFAGQVVVVAFSRRATAAGCLAR